MEEYFKVGVITTAHGVKGEVKVYPTTDDVTRFKRCKELLLDENGTYRKLEVEGVKFFKQFVLLKFKGIEDMDTALKLKNKSLHVTRDNAVRLKKDEYYIADLLGMTVKDEEGKEYGIISDVLQTGANDVYEITNSDGKSYLIPAIKECILKIDMETNLMTIHVMEGLLE